MKGLYIMIIHGKPSTEDTFSKYTRRRRWIRTAELIFDNKQEEALESSENVKATGVSVQDATTTKKVKAYDLPKMKAMLKNQLILIRKMIK